MSETIGQFFPVDAKHWWHVALRGFLALLFGILLSAWPGIALFIFAIIFGIYAVVDGIFTLVAAINYKAGAGKRAWLFVRGILGIIVGIVTLFWPAITEIALVFIIGAWALITGIMELSFAFTSVKETGAKWLFAISGILAIILGILLLIRPIAGIIAVIWFIGAYAALAGIVLIILGFRLRSVGATIEMETKQQKPKQKPKWQIILGWILFIYGILGIAAEIIFLFLYGAFAYGAFTRLIISGLLIWVGYELKYKRPNIQTQSRDKLISSGYKYYCKECGNVYKEDEKSYTSINGQLVPKCSCGNTLLTMLERDEPL